MPKIFTMRRDYIYPSLSINELAQNPIDQFEKWFNHANQKYRRKFISRLLVKMLGIEEIHTLDVNAMVLSTTDINHKSSTRVVLLKEFSENGLTFFGNYNSHKFLDLKNNPWASLLFYWPALMRQVRFVGKCKKNSAKESDDYFKTRPYESQISAWASDQSSPIKNREELLQKVAFYKKKFAKDQVKRPKFWGGYRLEPNQVEFWQGREDRLHDRFIYNLQSQGWEITRLAP